MKESTMALFRSGEKNKTISVNLNIPLRTVQRVVKENHNIPVGTPVIMKKSPGRPKKTSKTTERLLKNTVMKEPTITAKELKDQIQGPLQNVSVRTIQHRLQKDLKMPSRSAAMKPLITSKMKKKRLDFAKKYKDWTSEQWGKVMFSDESTFRTLRAVHKRVRRPLKSYKYSSQYTVKTMKHPESVMVWGCFTGDVGRGGLFFLPKNTTMNSERYIDVLENHMKPFMKIHKATHFLQDGAPCHTSKKVKQYLKDSNMEVIDWPGNSPDLNPIENVWSYMKYHLKQKPITSSKTLVDEIKKLWVLDMSQQYFKKLADSMPKRLKLVIKHKGEMTKY